MCSWFFIRAFDIPNLVSMDESFNILTWTCFSSYHITWRQSCPKMRQHAQKSILITNHSAMIQTRQILLLCDGDGQALKEKVIGSSDLARNGCIQTHFHMTHILPCLKENRKKPYLEKTPQKNEKLH